jgi:4-hydroxy-3-methylbut-2-en-1-yl diphosphate reductase
MVVEIDEKSGFCFGVQNAVEIAEEALKKGEKVFSLGQIVHNEIEVERLMKLGLEAITYSQFRKIRNSKVLIRAHGEPPETYRIAEQNNLTIIEATCPIVKKLQSRIHKTWINSQNKNDQVVIFGKEGHAEVIGLMGHTDNGAILTNGKDNLDMIDYTKDIHLYSQTTMSPSDYNALTRLIRDRIRQAGVDDPDKHLHINRTICGQVSNRQPALISFSKKHDVIIFVSGKESSNGRFLFTVCKNVNPNAWFISSPEELDPKWFRGYSSTGVCGATSTPRWLIERVRDRILSFGF